MRQAVFTCWVLVLALGLVACADKRKEAIEQGSVEFTLQRVNEEGLLVKEFDLNHDQKPDVFKFYRRVESPGEGKPGLVLVRRELDLNADGKVDVVTIYDENGDIVTEAFDLDFDGRVDLVDYYAKGQIVKKAIDFAFDEKPDIFKYYLRGELVRIEQDTTGNGQIDRWEYYTDGKLERIGIDMDGDGKVDTWRTADDPAPRATDSADAPATELPKAPDAVPPPPAETELPQLPDDDE